MNLCSAGRKGARENLLWAGRSWAEVPDCKVLHCWMCLLLGALDYISMEKKPPSEGPQIISGPIGRERGL